MEYKDLTRNQLIRLATQQAKIIREERKKKESLLNIIQAANKISKQFK